jgi:multiple sugar transport system permease protein
LIIPTFFANAYDVFLLRQYFMTLPRELDEAAMIDGAGPLRVLWSVILPQSYPAILAVTIFHIVWAWNDYFGPLIYLSTNMESQPISVALARFNGIYGRQPQLIQAGSLMTLIIR